MAVATMGAELERSRAETLAWRLREDDATRRELAAALPESVSLDRFTRAARTALIQNPDLAEADEATLFQALVRCALDGLLPDGREAALVIYKGRVQYLPMIGGVRKVVGEYGWTIKTHAIHANDAFAIDQATDRVTHRPALGDRGDVIGAWASAHHRDGRHPIVEVMDKAAIEKRRAVSRARGGPWQDWYAEMAEKTVGHRIAKKLPLDAVDEQRARRVIDAAELDPADHAAALYGEQARTTFTELPSGVTPDATPAEPAGSPTTNEPSARAAGGDDPTQDGSSQADTDPSAAAAVPAPPSEEDAMFAADYIPETGKYAPGGENGGDTGLTLAQIHEAGDTAWLRTAARRAPNPTLQAAAAAYVAIYLDQQAA